MGWNTRAQLLVVSRARLARWEALWSRLGAAGSPAELSRLERHYGEQGRHYHTLHHLDAVLGTFDSLRHLAAHPDEAELALWFHDVIWQALVDDCEERSAQWGRAVMERAGLADAQCRLVEGLVLETRHLPAASVNADAAVVRDADLAILAAPPDVFATYEQAIRKEYAMVRDPEFRTGRAGILSGFASRDPLFFTPAMQARTAAARANLAAAIARLSPLG
jgi:predicted metal-dependent HD superfamily phosphohydrolase